MTPTTLLQTHVIPGTVRRLLFGNSKRCCSSIAADAGRRAKQLASARCASKPALATLLAQSGVDHDLPNTPMAPPLCPATTYLRPADGIYTADDVHYARMDNPTRVLLERTMWELETRGLSPSSGESVTNSFAFSSGMMAATSILLAHSSPAVVLLPKDLYHGVSTLLHDVFSRHHVRVEAVDMTQADQVLAAVEAVDSAQDVIVWMETPSNPQCHVIDIENVCNRVQSFSNVTTVVDVTVASPVLTRPLEFGADISMHSGTKYLAGHSDALLGLVTTSPVTRRGKEISSVLRSVQIDAGGVASPWDSWLALRGMRTLDVRVKKASEAALTLANFLDQHPMVHAVHYPGLPSHPQHEVAKRQMMDGKYFGGVLSMELKDEVEATAFAGALQTIQRATSLGGTETLIEHRASVEPPGRVVSPLGLLRISVGLEDADDLIGDVESALSIVEEVVHNQS